MRSSNLRGLRDDFDVIAEVFRVMDKSLSESFGIFISNETTLLYSAEASGSNAKALSMRDKSKTKSKFKCHFCVKPVHEKVSCFDNADSKYHAPKSDVFGIIAKLKNASNLASAPLVGIGSFSRSKIGLSTRTL